MEREAAADWLEVRSPMQGWLWPLAKVPDPAFAEAVLGPGMAVDPLDPLVVSPIAGSVVTLHPSHHAIVVRHDCGIEVLVHVGIDTVELDGAGFTPLVELGQRVAACDPLIECDLDLIAARGLSLASPVIAVAPDGVRLHRLAPEGAVARGAVLFAVELPADIDNRPVASDESAQASVAIALPHGIHARPAAALARMLREAGLSGELSAGDRQADLASTVALMRGNFAKDETVTVRIHGAGAQTALQRVVELLGGDFAEAPPHTAPSAPASKAPAPEGQLRGLPGSAGLAAGNAFHHRPPRFEPPEQGMGIVSEQAALAAALDSVSRELEQAGSHGVVGQVMAAHRELAADPELRRLAEAGIANGQSAAFAWQTASDEVAALFANGDARLAERAADLADLSRRILSHLLGQSPEPSPAPAGSVVLAADLLPSDLAHYARCGVSAVALSGSSPTAHVAIIAAGLGLPLLTAIGTSLAEVSEGQALVVDADAGLLDLAPSAARLDEVAQASASLRSRADADRQAAHKPAVTRDGLTVPVLANLGGLDDAESAVTAGADGCGLLRTEFLFLNRSQAPDEAEQAETYAAIGQVLAPRPVTIRTLDIGGDKPVPFLPSGHEENPALGLRGLRVSLAHPALLDAQLGAVLRAARSGSGPIQLMVPMVSGLEEWRQLRSAVDRLGGTGVVRLGLMVETPAAVLLADQLAAEADFLSIGTNDLTQYVLAMDRTNPALAAQADPLHPAVLRAIGLVCAQAATHQCPVSVCGALAGDPLGIPLLIGLGVGSLSVVPTLVAATKRIVRETDRGEWSGLVQEACGLSDPAAVRRFVQSHLAAKEIGQ